MLSREAAGIWPTFSIDRIPMLTVYQNSNLASNPSSLVVNLAHTPSARIQRGGRVGLSLVPHGKLVPYKSYIEVIKIFHFIALP